MPAGQQLTDFGWTFHYISDWLNNNFWNVVVEFWGLQTSIGAIVAWVLLGSITIGFMRSLIGWYFD